jgi:hypothetical protein
MELGPHPVKPPAAYSRGKGGVSGGIRLLVVGRTTKMEKFRVRRARRAALDGAYGVRQSATTWRDRWSARSCSATRTRYDGPRQSGGKIAREARMGGVEEINETFFLTYQWH